MCRVKRLRLLRGGGTVSSFEGKDAARSKDAKRRRCKASIIYVILNLFQDLLTGSKDVKRHRCKANINNKLCCNFTRITINESPLQSVRSPFSEGATHVVLSNNSCQFLANYCDRAEHTSKQCEKSCKTQVLDGTAMFLPSLDGRGSKGVGDNHYSPSGTMCHLLPHRGEGLKEILKHGGQSDVQDDENNFLKRSYSQNRIRPITLALSRKGRGENASRFTLHPSLKRTYRPNVLTSYRLKKCAFTLAEVLITLGIIGVVAAMTIPTVVAKYQHKVLETQFKKAYSILYQLVLQVQNDTGMPLNVKDYSHAYTGDNYKLYNTLKPYIMANFCTTKRCIDRIEVDDGTGQNMKEYKTYNNKVNTSSYYMEGGGFILPDSMSIYIENYNEKNLMLSVDVNGVQKRPNRWGHDLFTFSIDNETGKLIPNGVKGARFDDTLREWGCSLTTGDKNNGITCSYYALTDPDYFKKLPK